MRRPTFFTQRKVAASAYVAGMLTFGFLAIPSHYYDSFQVRFWFGFIAALCAAGAIYEWWFRKELSEALRLLFDADRWAQMPKRTAGVMGIFDIRIGDPDGIGGIHCLFDSERERELHDWEVTGNAMKCEITNLSVVPLANIQLVFGMTFRKSIRTANLEIPGGNQYEGGEVLRTGDWSITIKALVPNERGVFYLKNSRDVFLIVTPPAVATVESFEAAKKFKVRLPIKHHDILLFPYHEPYDFNRDSQLTF